MSRPPDGGPGRGTAASGLRTMLAGSRAHPVPAAIGVASGVVNGLTMVVGAVAVGWSTDHLVVPALEGDDVAAATWWASATLIVGISLVRAVTIFLRGLATGLVQHGAQADTRRSLAERLVRLDLSWHRRTSPGRTLSTVIGDVDALWFPMVFTYFALGMVVMLGVALVQLALHDLGLGAVAAVLVIAVAAVNLRYRSVLGPQVQAAQDARSEVARIAHESVDGHQVVRTLSLGDRERERFAAATRGLRDANRTVGRTAAAYDPVLELLPTAAVLAVVWLGARRVESGDLTAGVVVEVAYLLLTAAIPLNVISRFLAMLPVSEAGREGVGRVLDATDTRPAGGRALPRGGPVGWSLSRAGLLRDGHAVVTDIDLEVRRGEVLAIVGGTGAGKSSLVDLLTGVVDPTAGEVRALGVPLAELAPGELTSAVAVVPQSAFLFADTIRENLTLGADHSDDQLWAALEVAAAADLVRDLPDGLDTRVGARGGRLSGGQRQRICLARAVLRRPRALVLDDATSALDPTVEADVLKRLAEIAATPDGPTVVLIANRAGSVRLADRVAFLRSGRLVEVATHDELLDRHDDYRLILSAYTVEGRADHVA